MLLAHGGDFLFVFEGVEPCVAQQGDDGDEKLGAHDVHFGVGVRHIDDAAVVEFAVAFQQRDEHGVFAVFFAAVFVQLFEKVFVFLFGGGFVVFVFHFKHDGDDFVACAVLLAEDVVAFAAAGGIVVFAELGLRERHGADAVELGFAMGFQAFADHFGGLAGFEVFVERDFFVFLFELDFVVFA